jgi:hypothetical protein
VSCTPLRSARLARAARCAARPRRCGCRRRRAKRKLLALASLRGAQARPLRSLASINFRSRAPPAPAGAAFLAATAAAYLPPAGGRLFFRPTPPAREAKIALARGAPGRAGAPLRLFASINFCSPPESSRPFAHPTRRRREAVIESEKDSIGRLRLVSVSKLGCRPKSCGRLLAFSPNLEARSPPGARVIRAPLS